MSGHVASQQLLPLAPWAIEPAQGMDAEAVAGEAAALRSPAATAKPWTRKTSPSSALRNGLERDIGFTLCAGSVSRKVAAPPGPSACRRLARRA